MDLVHIEESHPRASLREPTSTSDSTAGSPQTVCSRTVHEHGGFCGLDGRLCNGPLHCQRSRVLSKLLSHAVLGCIDSSKGHKLASLFGSQQGQCKSRHNRKEESDNVAVGHSATDSRELVDLMCTVANSDYVLAYFMACMVGVECGRQGIH